jgi:16S rRNA processing protein RimM
LVGKIIAAHGIKGLVKVSVFADDPALLDQSPLFTSEKNDQTVTLTLKSSGGKGIWLAEIPTLTDRNTAEKLRGTELWIGREALPDIEEEDGVYYHADLVGLSAQDEAGQKIGTVIAVENFGAGDLLEIKPETGESFYLPFTADFVLSVDMTARCVTVTRVEDFSF